MENADKSLEEFSKYLLVTVFSIFAFSSSSLLNSTITIVKVAYIMALLLAIVSMFFGFRTVLCKVNELIKIDDEAEHKNIGILPLITIIKMRSFVRFQYYFSLLSLIALILSICFHFYAENITSVFIKNLEQVTN